MSENIEFAMKNGLKREEKDSCRYRKQGENTDKRKKNSPKIKQEESKNGQNLFYLSNLFYLIDRYFYGFSASGHV